MSKKTQTEVVASIDMDSHSTWEDLRFLIQSLTEQRPYDLDYVNDPADDEPDFYLIAEVESDE